MKRAVRHQGHPWALYKVAAGHYMHALTGVEGLVNGLARDEIREASGFGIMRESITEQRPMGIGIDVRASVARLNGLLPLKARQDRLSPELRALHRAVVLGLVMHGRPPSRDEISSLVGEANVEPALARLGSDDLIVRSPDGQILGAYPATTEPTPHVVEVHGHSIHAMCSLDALSISAVFGCEVTIRSSCRVTGEPLLVRQINGQIAEASLAEVLVGVRWRAPPGVCAAHSLCREMVFLKDAAAAAAWHQGDLDGHSLYTLSEAVAFGDAYFRPLF